MNRIACYLLIFCFVFSKSLHAQQPAFYDEIQNFKHQDSINPPPQHAILFVGSSSFTKWTDVQAYFPGYTIINRGFGGSGLNDAIEYESDIIVPYHPKHIVIYSGENDVAAGASADEAYQRFTTLFTKIRK